MRRLYGCGHSEEDFRCNFGLNRDYEMALAGGGLVPSAFGADGAWRAVELPSHRFFAGTLFLPQARSAPGASHPVLLGFMRAAAG